MCLSWVLLSVIVLSLSDGLAVCHPPPYPLISPLMGLPVVGVSRADDPWACTSVRNGYLASSICSLAWILARHYLCLHNRPLLLPRCRLGYSVRSHSCMKSHSLFAPGDLRAVISRSHASPLRHALFYLPVRG